MSSPPFTDPCRLCGGDTPPEPRFAGLLSRCPTCGFTWTSTAPAASSDLYDAAYFTGEGYEDYFDHAARRYESRLRLRWLLETGPVGALIEAGAAGGFFVATAAAAGIDAQGVEMSQAAASIARESLNVRVHSGSFENASFTTPVDAVCAFHVLEHVEDPVEFLDAARRLLVAGGRLALEVPNIESAAAARLGEAWPHIQPRYHRWHFSVATLTRLVQRAGFDVETIDTVFSRFYWRRWGRAAHLRSLLIADVAASHSVRLTHPTMGDMIRVVARLSPQGRDA